MARNLLIPIRCKNSDGLAVTISETGLGHLTQVAGWANFEKVGDDTLRAQALSLPADFRRGLTTVWRVAPDRALIRSDTVIGFESSADLVVLDLSDARICITLDGPGASGLLSRVVPLDFSESSFQSAHSSRPACIMSAY